MEKRLLSLIKVLFAGIMALTVFLLFSFYSCRDIFTAKKFPIENGGILILDIIIIAALVLIYRRKKYPLGIFLCKYNIWILSISIIMLLVWQLYSCYSMFFITRWDVGTVNDNVYYELNGQYDLLHNGYFSRYPNNLFLVWIFSSILKFTKAVFGYDQIFALVVFQIILECIAIVLLFRVVYNFTKDYVISFVVYFVAIAFVGISPWYIVDYSDATGLVFPILILYIYQKISNSSKKISIILLYFVFGFVTVMGGMIKPQIYVASIAIFIFEIIKLFRKFDKKIILNTTIKFAMAFVGIAAMTIIFSKAIKPSLKFNLDENASFGMTHFLMMGSNEEKSGVCNDIDVMISANCPDKKTRSQENLRVFKERFKEYGFKRSAYHLMRKQLINYGDGTFAWAVEGQFFEGEPDWAHTKASEFLRSFIYPEGKHYNMFIVSKQMIWIFLLVMSVGIGLRKEKYADEVYIVLLSIIGLTIFELLFEARARYLFCYSIFFVIAGIIGLWEMYRYFNKRWISNKNQN